MGAPSDLVSDYELLAHGRGAFALGRDVLWVHGPDATSYLQGQCSQEIAGLAEGTSADSLVLSPEGKIDALIRVSRTGQDEYVIDVEGGFSDVVLARLARFKLRAKVELELLPWSSAAVRGTGVDLDGLRPEGPPLEVGLAAAVAWNDWVGVDVLGPKVDAASLGVPVVGPDAWDTWRIECGVPVLGYELDERTIAAEADLVERTVSFTKGCFTGQELVARLDARGSKVARHLVGFEMAGSDPLSCGPGAEITALDADKVLGTLTSLGWSPRIEGLVALGYLHRSGVVPGPVRIYPVQSGARTGESLEGTARPLPMV
jgi:folate-binding protein YgfZ